MKKIFLSALLLTFGITLFAQGIKFEESHNLNDALAKAQSENKLVFIDCYTTWCGPCKYMTAQIFPKEEVGEYFNAHFINLKLDMEASENLAIAKKYGVRAYPTFLFLNGDGEVVHSAVGGRSADQFIEVGKTANDSENNTAAMKKKIISGEKNAETLKKYFEANPYDAGNEAIADEYFMSLSNDKKTDNDNWEIFSAYVNDPKSASFKYFLANRPVFEEKIGKKEADQKLQKLFMETYYQDRENFESLKSIDPEVFEEAKNLIDINIAYSAYTENRDKETWDNLMKAFTPYLNKSDDPEILNNISWMVYENYKKHDDKPSLKNALNWAKKAVKLAPEKDYILDTYAHLLYADGKKKDAVKMETKALEMVQKANNTERIEDYKKAIEEFKK